MVAYWSKGSLDRYHLLGQVIARLRAERWQFKLDSGYSDYDLEIMGSHWARLHLTTVTEELAEGRVFRCRLEPGWSFRARAAFWLCFAAIMCVVGLLARFEPWLWMLPATLPVLHFFLNTERRRLHRSVAVWLDQISAELELVKL